MSLPKDPMILLSVINMKLRDGEEDLAGLCRQLDEDREDLEKRLAAAGFCYDPETNQFR